MNREKKSGRSASRPHGDKRGSFARRRDSKDASEKRYGRKSQRVSDKPDSRGGERRSSHPSSSSKRFGKFSSRGNSDAMRRSADTEVRFKRRKSEIEAVREQLEETPVYKIEKHHALQSYTPKPRKPRAKGEEGTRLNKFIANSGICSRREADEYIQQGLITVNGEVITELGTKVFQNDEVRYDGTVIRGEQKVYIVMNKPKGFVTTTSDPHADKIVLDLLEGKCKERVYPVGRLDRDTTGVLLITNDGEMTEKLTHPSHKKKKIYQVALDKNLKPADFEKILKGVRLEDGVEKADALSYLDGDDTQVGIEIHSGKNRVVRRIFEALGYKVKKLDRVYFAGLTKKTLRRGQWRFLTQKEIEMLKMGAYE